MSPKWRVTALNVAFCRLLHLHSGWNCFDVCFPPYNVSHLCLSIIDNSRETAEKLLLSNHFYDNKKAIAYWQYNITIMFNNGIKWISYFIYNELFSVCYGKKNTSKEENKLVANDAHFHLAFGDKTFAVNNSFKVWTEGQPRNAKAENQQHQFGPNS